MLKKTVCGDVIQFKVARTVLGRPIYPNYFYYLDGLLIDSGPPHVASEVIGAVQALPIEKVVVTHQHEDHTGNCALINERLHIPVYAPPGTLQAMKNPPGIRLYRKVMWGDLPPASGKPLPAVINTCNYRLEVIETPGHSTDHVCFFEPQNKWLFSGDLYLGDQVTGFMAGENIADHLESLRKVIALKPEVLFCGLKGRLENATERLSRKYNYWWDLGVKIKTLYEQNISRKAIMREALGGEVLFYYLSQLNWGRKHLLDSVFDNLDYFAVNRECDEQKHKPTK